MLNHIQTRTFEYSAQRVISSYIASLAEFELPSQQPSDLEASGREFRAFMADFYHAMYRSPGQFGLPLTGDICIMGGEEDPKQFKQDVKKVLDKSRVIIERGMDFLLFLGERGDLTGPEVVLEKSRYAELLKECSIKNPFLAGLAGVGLTIAEDDGLIKVSAPAYPRMMLAWKTLAQACCSFSDPRLGKFNFARVDLRALDGHFSPPALDLYKSFEPADQERLTRLHQFLSDLKYRPVYQIHGIFNWEVQYQGPTKIKASPLLRIHCDHRHKNSLQLQIKYAAVNRLLPLVSSLPHTWLKPASRWR